MLVTIASHPSHRDWLCIAALAPAC